MISDQLGLWDRWFTPVTALRNRGQLVCSRADLMHAACTSIRQCRRQKSVAETVFSCSTRCNINSSQYGPQRSTIYYAQHPAERRRFGDRLDKR